MFTKTAVACFLYITAYAQGIYDNNSTISDDAGELLAKIFPSNLTLPRTRHGVIKFEDEVGRDFVSFDDQSSIPTNEKPFKFQKDQEIYPNDYNGDTRIKFDNTVQEIEENNISIPVGYKLQPSNKPGGSNGNDGHKKKRRKRKPRKQFIRQPDYFNPGYPGAIGPRPGPVQGFGSNYQQPGFDGQFYRPPRRPRPSLASNTLVAVTGALTSIAQNDDYQCVARLLCEAAAGGALGGSSLLETVSGLEPLLTLLSAYNGISSNPLFVFGRATFLGMSSKKNPGSCRYAYPLCPTDPEQLVHYLNNHNGGFFRFFNSPQQGQQNLEQFYNQLSQNYGLYQPNLENNQEHYGFLNPGQFPNYGGQQPNLYQNGNGYQHNYGLAFPYNQNYNNANGITFKNDKEISANKVGFNYNKIEKRIQNSPASFLNEDFDKHSSKWLFPGEDDDAGEGNIGVQYVNNDDFKANDDRKGRTLRFPDVISTQNYYHSDYNTKLKDKYNLHREESTRKLNVISFPESQSYNYDYNDNFYPEYTNKNNFVLKNVQHVVDNNYNDNRDEPGVTTVYVVRGNGDPNRPEIVKLRPGETL